MTSAITTTNPGVVTVTERLDEVKKLMQIMRTMKDNLLIPKVDYGIIPGTGDKPSLLLPGMEKLMRALNAVPLYILTHVVRDYEKSLFHFEYECRLQDVDTGRDIPGGRGLGLCTSYETAFRWRWVSEERLPEGVDKSKLERRNGTTRASKMSINEKATVGKYAKPQAYWDAWDRAFAEGTARRVPDAQAFKKKDDTPMETWEMGAVEYRVTNPDMADQINTIMKRAKKRALADAVKGGAGVSEYFTVDVEDFYSGQDQWIIEGTAVDLLPAGAATEQNQGPVITAPMAPAKPATPAPAAAKPSTPPAPPVWYADAAAMAELVSKARSAGYIEEKQGEKDLLKLMGLTDWKGFPTRGDAANTLKAAAELLKAQVSASKPPAKPSYDPTEYSCVIEEARYDGKRILIQTQDHGRMTLWSRESLATAAGLEFADTWHIRTWQGTEADPGVYRFDPLKIVYVIDGKYPKLVGAEPVDKNDFDAYMGAPEAVMELAVEAEPIPF